jgi:hypothetical protein
MATEVAEPPVQTELPNPVIPEGIELSKKIFNDAMSVETPKEQVKETEPTKEPEPKVEAPEKKEEPVKEPELPPAAKKLPEELITGKKSEPKVDDAIAAIDAMVLPKNAKPEQVASFSKLKEQSKKVIEEKLGRIRELEAKTSEGTTRAEIEAAQERVKAAEAKAKEYESTIERLAFTESPRFKQFLSEETASLAGAKAYFEGTEINPEIIEVAARTAGSQRIKMLRDAGADADMIAAVSPYLAQYDTIQRHKAGALENWKAESTQYAEAQKAQQEAAIAQRRKSEDDVWSKAVSELSDLVPYRKFDKNDPWNSRADELIQNAKKIYNGEGIDLKEVAVKIIKGEAYDALDEVRIALTEELNNTLKENERLKAAKPSAGNGQVTVKSEANLTDEERRKQSFNMEMSRAKGGV